MLVLITKRYSFSIDWVAPSTPIGTGDYHYLPLLRAITQDKTEKKRKVHEKGLLLFTSIFEHLIFSHISNSKSVHSYILHIETDGLYYWLLLINKGDKKYISLTILFIK